MPHEDPQPRSATVFYFVLLEKKKKDVWLRHKRMLALVAEAMRDWASLPVLLADTCHTVSEQFAVWDRLLKDMSTL